MLTKYEKYHLPHNSIRIDEFNHMLNSIDLKKNYYYYEDLRLLFLQKQIKDNKLEVFHPMYDRNLSEHKSKKIRDIYSLCKEKPSIENLKELLDCQYTKAKTFKQVFNETVRDYTEFFAFLGLLPTYYKGRVGGEKKHHVTQRLKDYLSNKITLEEILLDFKYRNSSKDYDSLDMYHIEVRPFYIALKALDYYFEKGYCNVNKNIISAIVLYSKTEDIIDLLMMFDNPEKNINDYKNNFVEEEFESISDELDRATLFLRPYLKEMGYVDLNGVFYTKGSKDINLDLYPKRVAFCNSIIGNLSVTPVIGKIIYKLYNYSRLGFNSIEIDNLFDQNTDLEDRKYIINELSQIGCISNCSPNMKTCTICDTKNQISINPYTEFFEIDDCNYVEDIGEIKLYDGAFVANQSDIDFQNEVESIRQYALGSDGTAYERNLSGLIKDNFPTFSTTWYGANSTGKRLSDIAILTKIQNDDNVQNIIIIVECKAGNAIRAYDERKEREDVLNTLQKVKQNNNQIDGVWYWVVNGDSLPSVDSHGGYRNNDYSKNFVEKLNDIQFSVSETMRVPTIVTGFSFDAIKNYLCYLHEKTNNIEVINRVNTPHFWRWSKKFFNLQYVTVHKELRISE